MSNPPGRLALFDLDNTLIDRNRAFRAWAAGYVARSELDPSALDLLVAWDRDGHAPRAEVFGPLVETFGLSDTPEAIEARYRAEYPDNFAPDLTVDGGLADLRARGWRVVIVTNGPPSQIDKLTRTGLVDAVDGWCISDVVGSAKPDRGIFVAAAQTVSLPLDGWMVGDTPRADVAGGRGAGLSTIWISHGRPEPDDPELRADVTVATIGEAFSYLAALSDQTPATG